MSHVDEGQIQTYLDRQLEFADRSARERLEAHVASCTECAARLENGRSVHRGARVILDRAEIAHFESPPFSSLVEQAESTSTRRGTFTSLSRIRSLAVAASIMLAAAVGWYAQRSLGLLGSLGEPLQDSVPAPVALQLADSVTAGPTSEAVDTDQERPSDLAPQTSGSGAGGSTDVERPVPPPVETPVAATMDALEEADRVAAEPRRALSTETERRRIAQQRAEDIDTPVAARAGVTPELIDSVTRELIRTDASIPSVVAQATTPATWSQIDRGAAEQLLNQPMLAVDGLEIVLISTPRGGTDGLVRVVQLLSRGDSLELWQWPQGSAPPPELGIAAARVGSKRTAGKEVGQLVVWLMGPISLDSLETLIAGLSR